VRSTIDFWTSNLRECHFLDERPSQSERRCDASASRPSGEWNDDDFDVLASGQVVGRIFKANAEAIN
jgi:hypothetical protein